MEVTTCWGEGLGAESEVLLFECGSKWGGGPAVWSFKTSAIPALFILFFGPPSCSIRWLRARQVDCG